MKKLLLLLFAVPFVFTACSSDSDDDKVNSIVGTWKLQSHTFTAEGLTTEGLAEIISDLNREIDGSLKDGVTYTFTKEGKVGLSNGIVAVDGTYIFDGSTLTVKGTPYGDVVINHSGKVTFTSENAFTIAIDAKDIVNGFIDDWAWNGKDYGTATKAEFAATFLRQ